MEGTWRTPRKLSLSGDCRPQVFSTAFCRQHDGEHAQSLALAHGETILGRCPTVTGPLGRDRRGGEWRWAGTGRVQEHGLRQAAPCALREAGASAPLSKKRPSRPSTKTAGKRPQHLRFWKGPSNGKPLGSRHQVRAWDTALGRGKRVWAAGEDANLSLRNQRKRADRAPWTPGAGRGCEPAAGTGPTRRGRSVCCSAIPARLLPEPGRCWRWGGWGWGAGKRAARLLPQCYHFALFPQGGPFLRTCAVSPRGTALSEHRPACCARADSWTA